MFRQEQALEKMDEMLESPAEFPGVGIASSCRRTN